LTLKTPPVAASVQWNLATCCVVLETRASVFDGLRRCRLFNKCSHSFNTVGQSLQFDEWTHQRSNTHACTVHARLVNRLVLAKTKLGPSYSYCMSRLSRFIVSMADCHRWEIAVISVTWQIMASSSSNDGLYTPPAVQRPTIEQLRSSAEALHLHISPDELDEYRGISTSHYAVATMSVVATGFRIVMQ